MQGLTPFAPLCDAARSSEGGFRRGPARLGDAAVGNTNDVRSTNKPQRVAGRQRPEAVGDTILIGTASAGGSPVSGAVGGTRAKAGGVTYRVREESACKERREDRLTGGRSIVDWQDVTRTDLKMEF
jgi:hypothetical protein